MRSIALDPARVAAWRLDRQLVTPPARRSPETIARTLVGVQAQVVSAASMAVALRGTGLTVDAVPAALAERRLVRAWAMRGTLHVFDADDYPTIVGALSHRDGWQRHAWLRYFDVTQVEMEAIIEGVGEVLDDGRPRTRRELAADLGTRVGRGLDRQLASSWGSLLKPAADRGYLIHAAGEGSTVTFTRPDRWLGRWRRVDPDEALPTVLRRYLATYGPASTDEVRRWWGGIRSSYIKAALGELGVDVVIATVDGARGLLLAEDVDAIATTEPLDGGVHLLGPFDPFVVGAGAREALIPPSSYKRVSRTAGWISPVVLLDGVVAGIWDSRRDADRLRITVELFARPTRKLRSAVVAAAGRPALAQGLEPDVEFGPVFAPPGQASDE